MSRSNYSDDCDDYLQYGRWRGMVASAIRGERGQKLLSELVEALDAMPNKRLIAGELKHEEQFCALGVVGEKKRGLDLSKLDPEDAESVGSALNIAECLAQEITYKNDEVCESKTPEERWAYMRNWAAENIVVKK